MHATVPYGRGKRLEVLSRLVTGSPTTKNVPDVASSTASSERPELDVGVEVIASRRGPEEID